MGYVYELLEVNTSDKYQDVIGIFTGDCLEELKEAVENNVADLNEGVHDYIFIKKVRLNNLYPVPEELYIYKYSGKDSYKLCGVYTGKLEICKAESDVLGINNHSYQG